MSVDTDKIQDDLPRLMEQVMDKSDATNLRRDPTLRHFGLIADMTKEDQGGHYWIVVGGDIVLFVSTQVPPAERDVWGPPFAQLMGSLQITREDQLFARQVANELLLRLREKYPEQGFELEADKVRRQDRVVYLTNLVREVRSSPSRREEIMRRFVETLGEPATADLGFEVWACPRLDRSSPQAQGIHRRRGADQTPADH
jgi:hypothetical protein